MNTNEPKGLTSREAAQRQPNVLPKSRDGGIPAILRRNALTLFNLLNLALAGLLLLLVAQMFFLPAAVVFLSQEIGALWPVGLGTLLLVDVGMCALGSLLGALSQGGAARESLLSIVLFPLLVPLLLAGIGVAAQVFGAPAPDGPASWIGLAAAFDGVFLAAGLLLFGFMYSGDE